ncbi:MAG TPA: TonB-dependent receptor [Acidimicrobiia bacterium]|nr:TonB-dependent receptor [Casimicrobiaceae bacterium]HET9728997.1 TonB-dependent receptor [Acidimicrobiia bacterium]
MRGLADGAESGRKAWPALVLAALTLSCGTSSSSHAQATSSDVVVIDPITVTATRRAERAFDVPASVDTIDAYTLHMGQPQVNLSETLSRVPGVFAANRQNYAQDLQISSRGFGARAAFGVRGVRLYQDGIPVTMPDGQGQTGSFSLFSAQRIEVLRGPFSALYGNASGGVISVFTEDPPAAPLLSIGGGGGSYGTGTFGIKLGARTGAIGGVAAASEFVTSGYREHSWARRDLTNAKLVIDATAATRITLIGNTQYQPETEDPLGLSRAQWAADPRSVDPSAIKFDTRKTINQQQGGAALDHRFSDAWQLHVDAYGGQRAVRQYLALTGDGPLSSGGIPDLDRDYGGVGARLVWRNDILGRPLAVTFGADYDRQHERRRGYVNLNGSMGDLRRDEDDTVQSNDFYAQAEWDFAPRWSGTAGIRTSNVRYSSVDHYVTSLNPNDSGSQRFSDTSPVGGVVFHLTPNANVYASYGEGFETPTFAELAYRNGASGLNFALRPATSRAYEVGVKYLDDRHRLTAAIFNVDTSNEIVVDAATGGRTTFKNAGATRRRGAEVAWDGRYRYGLRTHVALTWLRAEFADAFTTGSPPAPVPAGTRLPGVPSKEAYGEIAWAPTGWPGLDTALEAVYVDKLYVNDRDADAAPAYAVINVRAGFAQTTPRVTWREFVRLNNLFDRNYAGSVIVGDTNGRFFEPAPGRNWFVGVSADVKL